MDNAAGYPPGGWGQRGWSGHNGRVLWTAVPAPIGTLGVAIDDVGVCAVRFSGPPAGVVDHPAPVPDSLAPVAVAVAAAAQLGRYFAGELTEFELPLSITAGSLFERAVWQAIAAIGYGEMRTYGQIASDVGQPDAARAVGVACNRNPLPVVVACHRVVGAGGKLVGFGGGLARKRHLLELEARVRVERLFGAQ